MPRRNRNGGDRTLPPQEDLNKLIFSGGPKKTNDTKPKKTLYMSTSPKERNGKSK